MKCLVILILVTSLVSAKNTAENDFINANNRFVSSIYKKISNTEKGNFLVSPFSAENILALAQSGCRGETAEELRNGLHLPEQKRKVESALKSLLPKLEGIKGNHYNYLHSANKIYVKKDFYVTEKFKRAATEVYHAESETIDFTTKVEAAKTMNTWVEKQTNNKIQNLINSNEINNHTRAVLLNGVYFNANWSNPFNVVHTKKCNFSKTATDVVEVDTLHLNKQYFNYYQCPHLKAKFLELTFLGGETSMVIVLPDARDGLGAIENQIEQVFAPQHNFYIEYLDVALPKFQIDSKINFKKVLQGLGVTKIFDDEEADLSGIAGKKGDLVINEVSQKSVIDVSEDGVGAGGPDFVLRVPFSGRMDYPYDFIADHPFMFYIKFKDLIVFTGRVADPQYEDKTNASLVREPVFKVKN